MTKRTRADDPAAFAQALLHEMLADERRGTRAWRIAAAALARDYEAPAAWRALKAADRETVLVVVDRVRQALEQTFRELGRPQKSADERAKLARVRKLAGELREAIEASPLPGSTVELAALHLSDGDGPNVMVNMGWHSLEGGAEGFGYSLAACDVLEWVKSAVDRFESLQWPRAAARRHDRTAHVQVFVRYLASHFSRHFGSERRTAIAHIASALFRVDGADAVLDAKAVDGFLKGRPAALTPRKGAARRAT